MTDSGEQGTERPHWSFWGVVVITLVWNALGCANFVTQMNPANLAGYPAEYQDFIATRPAWATAAFGLTVFAGLVGCILLLLRRATARPVFWLSALGALVSVLAVLGTNAALLTGAGMSLVVAAFQIWFATLAGRRGWLR